MSQVGAVRRRFVSGQAQPVEILDEGVRELGPAAGPIVILEPQDDGSVQRLRDAPGVDGVHDVAQVEVTRGRGREPGAGRRAKATSERVDRHAGGRHGRG